MPLASGGRLSEHSLPGFCALEPVRLPDEPAGLGFQGLEGAYTLRTYYISGRHQAVLWRIYLEKATLPILICLCGRAHVLRYRNDQSITGIRLEEPEPLFADAWIRPGSCLRITWVTGLSGRIADWPRGAPGATSVFIFAGCDLFQRSRCLAVAAGHAVCAPASDWEPRGLPAPSGTARL
jgi:hypothetical protein